MKVVRLMSCILVPSIILAFAVTCRFAAVAHEGHDHAPKNDEKKIKAALNKLPEADRSLAEKQRYCPMMDSTRLGSMGAPVKLMLDGRPVFVCCNECADEAKDDPKKVVAKAEKLTKAAASLAKLKPADLALAESQLFCPINEGSRLGSMGVPVKVELAGKPVFLCCKGCEEEALANPKETLAKVEAIKKAAAKPGHDDDEHDHKNHDAGKSKPKSP